MSITLNGKDKQPTTTGGVSSITLKVLMLIYTYMKCSSVLFRKDNELSQASFVSSFDDLGQARIDDKEIMF